jgi:hypothetical protein
MEERVGLKHWEEPGNVRSDKSIYRYIGKFYFTSFAWITAPHASLARIFDYWSVNLITGQNKQTMVMSVLTFKQDRLPICPCGFVELI